MPPTYQDIIKIPINRISNHQKRMITQVKRLYLLLIIAVLLKLSDSKGQNSIAFKKPIEIVLSKNYNRDLKSGSRLIVYGIEKKRDQNGYVEIYYYGNDSLGVNHSVKSSYIEDAIYPTNPTIEEVWEIGLIKEKVYHNLLSYGYQYDLRSELNQEAVSYLNILNEKELIFNDSYLEDYIYKLLNKIHVGYLADNRPGNLSIKILKDATPNAMTLSNGCIIVSTGLLSCMRTESELISVLAHEVAHFVNDHHVLSYAKEIERQKRAEFWGTLATSLAIATDAYLASNNKNYTFGILSSSAAIAATLVSETVVERMGIKYSHEQEFNADFLAKNALNALGIDDYSFASALQLLEKNFYMNGQYTALVGGKTHPSINDRIFRLGFSNKSDTIRNDKYDAKISLVNTFNAAWLFYTKSDFLSALKLVNRNILANAGSADDFLIKSRIIRRLSDTQESNLEALELLNKSKQLSSDNLLTYDKDEALIHLRLNDKTKAKECFNRYRITLSNELPDSKQSLNSHYLSYMQKELSWTNDMLSKIDSL